MSLVKTNKTAIEHSILYCISANLFFPRFYFRILWLLKHRNAGAFRVAARIELGNISRFYQRDGLTGRSTKLESCEICLISSFPCMVIEHEHPHREYRLSRRKLPQSLSSVPSCLLRDEYSTVHFCARAGPSFDFLYSVERSFAFLRARIRLNAGNIRKQLCLPTFNEMKFIKMISFLLSSQTRETSRTFILDKCFIEI